MTTVPSPIEADGMVVVRLSEIPLELREKVADRLVAAWERHGVHPERWLELRLAAISGTPDVALEVPAWKADLVLAGKQPVGSTPEELLW